MISFFNLGLLASICPLECLEAAYSQAYRRKAIQMFRVQRYRNGILAIATLENAYESHPWHGQSLSLRILFGIF